MKVNIDKTLQVSDEQRKAIAALLDGEGAKAREATRDEMKDFIWNHGSSWEHVLTNPTDGPLYDDDAPVDEDLVGTPDDPELDLGDLL